MLASLPPELIMLIGGCLDLHDLSTLIRTAKTFKVQLNAWLYRWDIENGGGCVEWAAENGTTGLLRRAIDYSPSTESIARVCQAAMETATEFDQVEITKILLSVPGVDPNIMMEAERRLLTIAGLYNASDVATLLLDTGKVDINAEDEFGCTALWYAAECGNEEVLQVLLDKGAAPDAPDLDGQRPLTRAIRGSPNIVRMLLDTGNVRIHHLDTWRSPLHTLAATFRGTVDDDDYQEDATAAFALESKNERDAVEMAGLLLKVGADVNSRTIQNDTALSLCIRESGRDSEEFPMGRQRSRCSSGDLAKFLIESGADINSRDHQGSTLLILAIKCQHEGIVRLLLQKGADWNETGAQGTTPLDVAVAKGNKDIVQFLVDAGAAAYLGENVTVQVKQCQDGTSSIRLVTEPAAHDEIQDT